MNKTENLSYPENPASVSWQEMDRRYWKMVHCNPGMSNLIAIEIFHGNPRAKDIVQSYLDKGYTCLGAEEHKYYSLYWFDKEF